MHSWSSLHLDTFTRDVRHNLRRLARDWPFTAAAVVILGLGIGATTAVFSVVNAILFRHGSPSEADRVVNIYQRSVNPGSQDAATYPAYLDMAGHRELFSGILATTIPRGVTYLHQGVLRSATVENTTATYPSVLGLRPSLGRWFRPEEDVRGAPVVAVVGYQAWKVRFASDSTVVGRSILIDGVPVMIVGVGPVDHRGSFNVGVVTDFWLPIESLHAFGMSEVLVRHPREAVLLVQARMAPGVTVDQVQAAMSVLGARFAADYPDEDPGRGIQVIRSTDVRVHPQLDGPLIAVVSIVLGVAGLVLAIACANLVTLLLVRGAARAREISIRLAIGATRAHVTRQLLTESMLLTLIGGSVGCLLSWWGVQWLRTLDLPFVVDIALDGRVLTFAIVVSLATGVACGLAPAMSATRVDVLPSLRGEGIAGGGKRLTQRNALIAFQVSMSVLLLGCAVPFLQWAAAERARPVGYAVDGVAMIETDSRFSGASPDRRRAVLDEVLARVAALPEVRAVTLTRGLPMQPTGQRVLVEGVDANRETGRPARSLWAAPGFHETLDIPLLRGRTFDTRDQLETPRVAVISETMAREYFAGMDAVGRRFRLESAAESWIEVIGIARDAGAELLDPEGRMFYLSTTQVDGLPTTIVARTAQGAEGLLAALQHELRAVDPALPVISVKTMARHRADMTKGMQSVAASLGAIGALGALLAGVGLYAVIAFAVQRRTREIGIRMAVGASSPQVVWVVIRDAAGFIGLGTAIGLLLSILATLALRAAYAPAPGLSFFRPSVDPIALSAIALIMALIGVAAAYVPARRVTRIDPLAALRAD